MDGTEYDVVVCGTGFTESILSGLLSLEGKKVLHIDRNSYYGDEGASLNLSALWKKFRNGAEANPKYGNNRDWNVDLIPKFVMASGILVKMLLKTQVSYYLRWKPVDATYVYQWKKGGLFSKDHGAVEKVPSSAGEALKSDLMSFMEKRRCQKFLEYVSEVKIDDPSTWKKCDLNTWSFADVAKKYKLEANTLDFIGHAVALYTNDDYINYPSKVVLEKIQLYIDSVGTFGPTPFIYPVYGLGGIPEGFSRKCAVGGGTFILNQGISKILLSPEGKAISVADGEDGEKLAKTKMVIASPSYMLACGMSHKVKKVGDTIRCICILDKQIPALENNTSAQIIIPQRQTGRKSDIYIMAVGTDHAACSKGFYLAIISTTVETSNPVEELNVAFSITGKPLETFISITPLYVATDDGKKDNIFVTSSLDATSHFESAANDVLKLYKSITGTDLDLNNLPDDIEG